MSNIERVDFYGDELQAVREGETVRVVLRPICDALGIDAEGQRRRLKSKPWGTPELISAVGADGKRRQMATIPLRAVPMMLATIEPSKVAPAVRSKLERYQLECAEVLAEHFMPAEPAPPPPSPFTSAPLQARIGDDARASALVRSLCRVAARVSGLSVQRIQGQLRKPWGVMSVYRIALSALDHTVAQLHALIDAPPVRRLPPNRRQTDLFGEN